MFAFFTENRLNIHQSCSVSRHYFSKSRSRLGLEGLKPRSRHLEVLENGQVSAIFPIRA